MAQFTRLGKREVRCHIDDMAKTPASPPKSAEVPSPEGARAPRPQTDTAQPREIGGPKGPEPTRYGDWEVNGRCSDF